MSGRSIPAPRPIASAQGHGGPAPRPWICDLPAYVPGEQSAGGKPPIRLAANEGALGPSPKAVAAIRAAAADMHRYPAGDAGVLRAAVGARWNLDPARIVLGNGSDELLSLLNRAYCGPDDTILHSAHGFLMYSLYARAVGATAIAVPERADLRADVDGLLAAVDGRTRIVFLANPNNPTASWLTRDELTALADGLRDDVLLVIDSAYAEFMLDADGYETGAALVDSRMNVAMTRTFSKAFGLGGLRLGFLYGPTHVVETLGRLRDPFSVSSLAQAGGIAALDDTGFMDQVVAHTAHWRQWLSDELTGLGLHVWPSLANFLLVEMPDGDGLAVQQALKARHGVIVRQVASYGLPHCLRITIGTGDEMRAARAALADVLGLGG